MNWQPIESSANDYASPKFQLKITMSTVAEHLALLEYYCYHHIDTGVRMEAETLVKVHLKELIEQQDAREMEQAREALKRKLTP